MSDDFGLHGFGFWVWTFNGIAHHSICLYFSTLAWIFPKWGGLTLCFHWCVILCFSTMEQEKIQSKISKTVWEFGAHHWNSVKHRIAFPYFANACFWGTTQMDICSPIAAAAGALPVTPWYSAAASLSKEFPALQCLSNHVTCVTEWISRWWFLKDLLACFTPKQLGLNDPIWWHMFYITWWFEPPPRVICLFCPCFIWFYVVGHWSPRSI